MTLNPFAELARRSKRPSASLDSAVVASVQSNSRCTIELQPDELEISGVHYIGGPPSPGDWVYLLRSGSTTLALCLGPTP